MKRKVLYMLLILEAALCVAYNLLKMSFGDTFTAVMVFPFDLLGWGLRELSLTGRLGNALSLTLYTAVSLVPVFLLLSYKSKRRLKAEDSLLGLLTASLFIALYLFINPEYIGKLFCDIGEAGITIGKVILGSTIWSVIVGYIILRVLRLSFARGTDKLLDYSGVLLGFLSLLFVWAAFGGTFGVMMGSFSSLLAGNNGTENGLGLTYIFLALRYITAALPNILNVFTVLISLNLLAAMRADRYSEQTEQLAIKLSHWCGKTLAVVVSAEVLFNLLQLVFAGSLRNLNSSVNIPITSILFVLAVLLFARLISENRRLKTDNDLII